MNAQVFPSFGHKGHIHQMNLIKGEGGGRHIPPQNKPLVKNLIQLRAIEMEGRVKKDPYLNSPYFLHYE